MITLKSKGNAVFPSSSNEPAPKAGSCIFKLNNSMWLKAYIPDADLSVDRNPFHVKICYAYKADMQKT